MSDLIDDPAPGMNAPEFSVTEISGAIKRMIEGEFSHVRIRGEIGRVSRPRSGHIYLDLKDDRNVMAGVIWKGVATKLATQPEEGLEVVATGRLTTFGGQSKYQMVIEDIAPAGMGALMAMLEKRKKQLEAEGLFAPECKSPIPYLPEVIGVVTSPSGAVIRDILHRLRDRFPRKVLIWPVAVQGAKCAPEVARAIEGFNTFSPGGALPRPDLLIVARGGGSIEDLWGFNEEIVARAVAASDIPLISAVGHETDTTLIDYVSDYRAPTPTAAAERAVPVRLELLAGIDSYGARLTRAQTQLISLRGQRLADLSRALPKPATLVEAPRQRLDNWGDRLGPALTLAAQRKRAHLSEIAPRAGMLTRLVRDAHRRLDERAARLAPDVLTRDIARKRDTLERTSDRFARVAASQLDQWDKKLEALDRMRQTLGYRETLKRGYAVVRDGDNVITTRAGAEQADGLEIEFQDGRIVAGAAAARPARTKAKPKPTPPDQGSLF